MMEAKGSLFDPLVDIPLSDIYWMFYQVTRQSNLTLRDVQSLGFENLTYLLAQTIHDLYNNIVKGVDNDAYINTVETFNNLGLNNIAMDLADNICFVLEKLVNSYRFVEGSLLTDMRETYVTVEDQDKLCPLLRISEVKQTI